MTVDSYETVFYTAVFLLPGFIVYSLIRLTNPIKKKDSGELLLPCLGYSIICLALFSPFYFWTLPKKNELGGWYWLLIVTLMIVISGVVGIILSCIQASNWLRKLSIFGLRIIDPIPTAWDKIFSQDISRWVYIHLKDGSCIFGLFSYNSYCSAFSEGPDIYLETVYDVEENGKLHISDRSQGIYVKGDEIKYIEVYEV